MKGFFNWRQNEDIKSFTEFAYSNSHCGDYWDYKYSFSFFSNNHSGYWNNYCPYFYRIPLIV